MDAKQKKAWLAVAAICIIWGTTYLFLKIGVTEVAPFLFSGIRQLAAGLILLMIILFKSKVKKPSVKMILKQSMAGFFMITLGNGLVAYGELSIPSSMAAVICATMPVWIAVINSVLPGRSKLSWTGYLGIIIGIGGILLLFSDSLINFRDSAYITGAVLTLVATFGWILGSFMIMDTAGKEDPFLMSAIQMISGGLGLLLISAIFEDNHSLQMSSAGWFALLYLIVFGSIIAMGAYAYALQVIPLQVVSMYAYINPIVAIILGWIVLNESMTWMTLGACMVIILGVVLLNLPKSKKLVIQV